MAKDINDSSRLVLVKIQSVRVLPLTVMGGAESIGSFIDGLLADYAADNETPNKLMIDLNPPTHDSHASMEME